ncbi:MAG: hypothetical protein IJ446_03130 [Oscillospiraceae bacterium]|nr:hypothetical protein [Oscillospiraceae bacterium]
MKKKKIVLLILIILSVIFVFPLNVKKQCIEGIAVSSEEQVVVAVRSVHAGDVIYLYMYSNDILQNRIFANFRGTVTVTTTEDDLICIYYDKYKFFYDFDGRFLRREENSADKPATTYKYKIDNAEYIYSQNSFGFETVKKYTANGKMKLIFGGKFLYFKKILMGLIITSFPVLFIYILIFYPFRTKKITTEDIEKMVISLQKGKENEKKSE